MVLHKPAKLSVSADPTGLPVGTYTSLVSVGSPTAGITVPVTLQICPNDLAIPQVADGNGWKTVITLVNTDSVPAPFTVKFWQQDGTPLVLPLAGIGSVSEYSDTIPLGGTRTLQTLGLSPTTSQGWAELAAQGAVGGTAIFRRESPDSSSEAVVTFAPSLGSGFLLPFDNLNSYQTGLAVVNTGESQSSISLSFHDENGDVITSDSISLSPHGSKAFVLQINYPQLFNRRGIVVCSSTGSSLSAVGLRFSPSGSFTSFQPQVPQLASVDTIRRTIPQIADGSGWKTTFVLANPSPQPVPFSIVFRDPQLGTPMMVPLALIGASAEYADVIPPGGVRTFETAGDASSLVEGWAEIVSSGAIGGTVIFGQAATNSEATVQVRPSAGERFVFPFDNSSGLNSALALLNANRSEDKLATVILRDENGNRLTTEYLQLKAMTDQTFLLSDRFPSSQNMRGSIEFSGAAMSTLGLLFNPAGSFTSMEPLIK